MVHVCPAQSAALSWAHSCDDDCQASKGLSAGRPIASATVSVNVIDGADVDGTVVSPSLSVYVEPSWLVAAAELMVIVGEVSSKHRLALSAWLSV